MHKTDSIRIKYNKTIKMISIKDLNITSKNPCPLTSCFTIDINFLVAENDVNDIYWSLEYIIDIATEHNNKQCITLYKSDQLCYKQSPNVQKHTIHVDQLDVSHVSKSNLLNIACFRLHLFNKEEKKTQIINIVTEIKRNEHDQQLRRISYSPFS